MKKKHVCILKFLTALFSMMLFFSVFAYAEGEARVVQTDVTDNVAKLYIAGLASQPDGGEFQIGKTACPDVKVSAMDKDNPISTLILIDNSLSISKPNREKVKAVLDGIIGAHTDNEKMRLATFSDKINYLSEYSNDYTALTNIADSLKYVDQDTYLIDVLADVLDGIKADHQGFVRIVVISDGVDDKTIGVTKDELYDKVKSDSIPIYCIGSKNGKNDSELENMFAISRLSGTQPILLDDIKDASEVVKLTTEDNAMFVVSATIPDELQDGSVKNSKLKLSDGTELTADIQMPFGDAAASTAAPVASEPASETETATETEATTEESTEEQEDEGLAARVLRFMSEPLVLIITIVIVVVLILAIIIIIVTGKMNKNKPKMTAAPVKQNDTVIGGGERTEYIGGKGGDGATQLLFNGQGSQMKHAFQVTLVDKTNPGKMYQCELVNSIVIGRNQSSTDICIDYDKSVSGKHCMITSKNSKFYLQDLGSSNGTLLNDEKVAGEREIFNGDTLQLGRVKLGVSIK